MTMQIKFDDFQKYQYKICSCCGKSIRPKVGEKVYRYPDLVADIMGGSGTILVACAIGRDVCYVELESKFIDMAEANWEKIKSLGPILGYTMGTATILQGDSRQLGKMLVDKYIFSPPFARCESTTKRDDTRLDRNNYKNVGHFKSNKSLSDNPSNIGNLKYGEIDKVIFSPPYAEVNKITKKGILGHTTGCKCNFCRKNQGNKGYIQDYCDPKNDSPDNISNLPYGSISAIVSSPPYEGSISGKELPDSEKLIERKSGKGKWGKHLRLGKSQLTKYADSIICSPPYEGSVTGKDGIDWSKGTRGVKEDNKPRDKSKEPAFEHSAIGGAGFRYSEIKDNIGNLKGESYLQAMLITYQQCHKVLREKGLLVLVLKNFIRNKKIIRLDLDTIRLCEQAGFGLKERLKRKLTQQSFWRNLQFNKCDYRTGKKCKLGLSCPTKKEAKTLFDLGMKEKQIIEKLCPKYINTVPPIIFEDILVMEKANG